MVRVQGQHSLQRRRRLEEDRELSDQLHRRVDDLAVLVEWAEAGEPVAEDSDAMFDQCPKIGELEVLVGSSNGRTFNRLTLYAGPYVAGPYAEGAYEVHLPVDAGVLAAVKPEYREAFGARN